MGSLWILNVFVVAWLLIPVISFDNAMVGGMVVASHGGRWNWPKEAVAGSSLSTEGYYTHEIYGYSNENIDAMHRWLLMTFWKFEIVQGIFCFTIETRGVHMGLGDDQSKCRVPATILLNLVYSYGTQSCNYKTTPCIWMPWCFEGAGIVSRWIHEWAIHPSWP
jgi:hypothetical protein